LQEALSNTKQSAGINIHFWDCQPQFQKRGGERKGTKSEAFGNRGDNRSD